MKASHCVMLVPTLLLMAPTADATVFATNVALLSGVNRLEVYQRDLGGVVAGLILICTVSTSCGTVAVQEKSWGSIKSMFR